MKGALGDKYRPTTIDVQIPTRDASHYFDFSKVEEPKAGES